MFSQFLQFARIIHSLSRIAIELESKETDSETLIRALSIIEDAHIKGGEPESYSFVFPGEDDIVTVTLLVSIEQKEGEL